MLRGGIDGQFTRFPPFTRTGGGTSPGDGWIVRFLR